MSYQSNSLLWLFNFEALAMLVNRRLKSDVYLVKKCQIVLYFCALCLINIDLSVATEAIKPNGRIVGGTAATASAAPFIVSIQQNGVHYCGGSILNTKWIVTAAHCLTSKTQALSSTLVAGSKNVKGTDSTTQTRSITSFVIHELYTGGTAPYDIGLVYTATPFTFTAAVSAVQLPASGSTPTGNANLYGWGSTSMTSVPVYPTQLQVATLPIISTSSCETALGPKGNDVHSTNICTGPLTGGIGICTSDSGGPLVQGNTLVGIVSWGKVPCGQVNSPSVYVKVSDFISWITQNQKA